MATEPKDGKLLYHLTSIVNLKSIFSNGLIPRGQLQNFHDIADLEIISHREENDLNSLVPFHFFPGTPFAGVVQDNNPKTEFVFIAIKRDFAKHNGFKILTRHPLSLEVCDLYDYKEGFQKIDWDLMKKRDYQNHECKMVCMAECLAPFTVIKEMFARLYVRNEEIKQIVENIYSGVCREKKTFDISVNTWMFKKR